jgi:hypothetical protein
LQVAAAGADEFGQLLVRGFDLLVDGGEFDDQFGGQLPAGACDDVARPDRVEQGAGLRGGQELLRSARQQLQEQFVDPVDGVSP